MKFLKKVIEVRRIIESEACRYAAHRATKKEISAIEVWFKQMEAILNNEGDYEYHRYLEIDMAFHTSILDACHNELLAQIGHTMRYAVQTARKADRHDIKTQQAALPHHEAILKSIRKHDGQAAYQASQAMFDQVWHSLFSSKRN